MRKLVTCGIDVDDCLYSCNEYAVKRTNEKYGLKLKLSDIKGWGATNGEADLILENYQDEEFFKTQPVLEGAKEFLKKLSSIAEVFITTAVPVQFTSARIERLLADFGDIIPQDHIIIGSRKDLYNVDITLDDNPGNILASKAKFPILMRMPWNSNISGRLSVNNLEEALSVIKEIITDGAKEVLETELLCLVGPSGSGKTTIIEELERDGKYVKPITTTTRKRRTNEKENAYEFLSKEEFLKMKEEGEFFESSVYAGEFYGTQKKMLNEIKKQGKIPVMALDISGAMAMRMHYPATKIVFINRSKEDVLNTIIERNTSNEEKVRRILSLDDEYRNADLCDVMVDNTDLAKCIEKIKNL